MHQINKESVENTISVKMELQEEYDSPMNIHNHMNLQSPNVKQENDNTIEINLPSLGSLDSKDANDANVKVKDNSQQKMQMDDKEKEHDLDTAKEENDGESICLRKRQVSGRQLNILYEFLNSHRNLAVAYNRSLRAKEYSKKQWMHISKILNAQGDGTHKDWRGWSKYWIDYKARLKRKAAAIRLCQLDNGGLSMQQSVTDIDLNFFKIIGDDFGQTLQSIRDESYVEPTPNIPLAEFRTPQPMSPIIPSRQASPTESLRNSATSTSPPTPHAPLPVSVRIMRRRYPKRSPPKSQLAARHAIFVPTQQKSAASERAAEIAERRAEASERRAEAAERRAEAAERRAEAAERAEAAHERAEAALRSAQALETIANSLRVIERCLNANAVVARGAE